MKRIIIFLALFILAPVGAQAFRLIFTPSSGHTDNTAYTSAELPVVYDFWIDGAVLATGAPGSPISLTDNTYGAVHTYKGRTRTADGRVSDNVTVTLTSPFDLRIPGAPGVPWSIGN